MNIKNNWKDGDIYRWSYNTEESQRRKDHHNIYWCCSRIGIVRNGILTDTFWSGGNRRSFNLEETLSKLDLEYLGNLNDYEPCNQQDQAMYDDKDFLNLSHPNNSNQYFLKKGAVKSKEKMIKIIKRNALKLQFDYEYAKRALEWELEKLDNLDELNYAYGLDGVNLTDDNYCDEEFYKLEKQ